jgi:hypothetical protein
MQRHQDLRIIQAPTQETLTVSVYIASFKMCNISNAHYFIDSPSLWTGEMSQTTKRQKQDRSNFESSAETMCHIWGKTRENRETTRSSPGGAISYPWHAIFRGCIMQVRKTAKGSKNRIENRSHHHHQKRERERESEAER